MSRTRKKEYTGSKKFDRTCRNHGSCGYCEGNRTYNARRKEAAAREQMRDYVVLKGYIYCNVCDGTGCLYCNWKGHILYHTTAKDIELIRCPRCQGTGGDEWSDICDTCAGKGFIPEQKGEQ